MLANCKGHEKGPSFFYKMNYQHPGMSLMEDNSTIFRFPSSDLNVADLYIAYYITEQNLILFIKTGDE